MIKQNIVFSVVLYSLKNNFNFSKNIKGRIERGELLAINLSYQKNVRLHFVSSKSHEIIIHFGACFTTITELEKMF